MRNQANHYFIAALILGLFIFPNICHADPSAPTDLNIKSNGRRSLNGNSNLSAFGGNITNVDLSQTQITGYWQGYWGEVTGGITLDDSSNRTFYDWSSMAWGGVVFATRATISSWGTITCANITTMDSEESLLGIPLGQTDGINETFNNTYADVAGFWVSTNHIDASSNCPSTNVFSNELVNISLWKQILLYEPTSSQTVYSTQIESDATAYANLTLTADFQLLVGANSSNIIYYFYIDLT